MPDPDNWSQYPNIWGECQKLIEEAAWYRVYDFVEELYQELEHLQELEDAEDCPFDNVKGTLKSQEWAERINEYFLEAGVGWRLVNGTLESRGAAGFEESVDSARAALEAAGLQTAQHEIHEAMRDLSRRPTP